MKINHIPTNPKTELKAEKTKENQTKTIIPHYIIEASIKYNHYILPIYLYLKRKKNVDDEIFFDYNSMLKYFQDDKFGKKYEEQILTALIFLFSGVKEIGIDAYGEYIINNKIQHTFQISKRHNILSNIFENILVTVDIDEESFHIDSQEYDIQQLLKLLISQLDKEGEILLYDNTTEGIIGYLLVNNNVLIFIDWYIKKQTSTLKKFEQLLKLKDKNKLEKLLNQYEIERLDNNKTKKISYITFINLYIYIFKLYNLNYNLGQKTIIGTTTMTKKLSCSNSTITLYIRLMESLGLLKTKKGTFQNKTATSFIITDKYKKYEDLDELTIYIYSIITKEQFEEIKSCYNKLSSISSSTSSISQTNTTPIKRGRGRPKKNSVI